MQVFLVNKEFGVLLSSAIVRFSLHDGDLVWIDERRNKYIYKIESNIKDFDGQYKKYICMIPVNLNGEIWCFKSLKSKKIDLAIEEGYITDITTQYNRDLKINELWKSLEPEI